MKTTLYFQIKLALAACHEQRPYAMKIDNVKARLEIILKEMDPYRYKQDDFIKAYSVLPSVDFRESERLAELVQAVVDGVEINKEFLSACKSTLKRAKS